MYFRSYHSDPVLNPLTPWDRPPVKNVFCIYGIDLKTEVYLHFSIEKNILYDLEKTVFSF